MKKEIRKAAWVYVKNSTVLVARSRNHSIFFLPGGAVEEGEADIEALVREVKEELSVDINKDSIQYFDTFKAPSFEQPTEISIIMICFTGRYKGVLMPAAEIEEIGWFHYDDKRRVSAVDQLVLGYLKEKNLLS